jgi:hypothetical protein
MSEKRDKDVKRKKTKEKICVWKRKKRKEEKERKKEEWQERYEEDESSER